MSNVLAMFPGQGSQHVGMSKDLLEQFPAAKQVFEEASDSINTNILKLCAEGPESDLTLTANTQPCILTVSTATWRILKSETDLNPVAFAGHSLGEYSALVASEKLDFSRACYLVRRRGESMQKAVPAGVGAMAAVLNVEAKTLNSLCEKISTKEHSVQIANYNSTKQLVVAGHKPAVDLLCKKLEADKIRCVVLPVSAPFHSKLMSKAKKDMTPLLQETKIKSNNQTIIANLTGNTVTTEYDFSYLAKQIDHPVLWTQTMDRAIELECDTYVEIGPGRVLFGLAKRAVPKDSALITTTDIKKAISSLNA